MTKLKDEVADIKHKFADIEKSAGKLKNKNLADVIRGGVARLQQALDHPDIDLVQDDEARAEAEKTDAERRAESERDGKPLDPGAPLNSGGNEMFAAGDPGASLQNEEARRRSVFPAPETLGNGPSSGAPVTNSDPDVKHPGDPEFMPENNNPNFQDPNNVDLNPDGTLRRAPNAFSKQDVRKE